MGVGILAKRVVLELGSSTNFVYSLQDRMLWHPVLFYGIKFRFLFFSFCISN